MHECFGRLTLCASVGFATIVSGVAVAKDGPNAGAAQRETERAAAIDKLAHEVFAAADANHNQALNRLEFQDALALLEEAVADWAREGFIGRAKRPAAKDHVDIQPGGAAAAAERLTKTNRIRQAEFTFYVHTFVDEADLQFQQLRVTSEAQRKAFEAQRRANRLQRRPPVRYGVPLPLQF